MQVPASVRPESNLLILAGADDEEDREEMDAIQAARTPEKQNAERLVADLAEKWEGPLLTWQRSGRLSC